MMRKTKAKGVVMLLLTALIWGISFVAQSAGMEKIGAFTFSAVRTLMGAVSLLPFVLFREKALAVRLNAEQKAVKKIADRKTWLYGCILGVVFCVASNFQQFAFLYSSPGKIAFITALYMFFVPVSGLFFGRRVKRAMWLCVALGFVGLYFLCVNPGDLGAINQGDLLSFICSIFFAAHILLVDRFARDLDGLKLSCIQFWVAGILSSILMFAFEKPDVRPMLDAAIPLLYSGVFSCGVAYTCQIIGQKYCESTVASLLMCMESVFAVLAAALIMHDTLSGRETLGCAVMFAAILLSQYVSRPEKTV